VAAVSPAARGWVPVEIPFTEHPALVSDPPVRWMELGRAPLAEPFFAQTLARLKAGEPPPREIDTGLDALLAEGARGGDAAPAGFVFHISRCGSSLVANGLRTAAGTQVLAEARPMTALFLPYPATGDADADARWAERRSALGRALVTIVARYRDGEPEAVVIKWTSLNTTMLPAIRAVWPDTPALFVVRDPLEVLVANLHPGGLIDTRHSALAPALSGVADPGELAGMGDEEYGARVLGRYLETALAGADLWALDYEDIDPRTLRAVAERFGREIPAGPQVLEPVFTRHAKDPAGLRVFEDDREAKRRRATRDAVAAVEAFAAPAYRALLEGARRVR
jgi:hypothetical protein